jgi:hypothetical protein
VYSSESNERECNFSEQINLTPSHPYKQKLMAAWQDHGDSDKRIPKPYIGHPPLFGQSCSFFGDSNDVTRDF